MKKLIIALAFIVYINSSVIGDKFFLPPKIDKNKELPSIVPTSVPIPDNIMNSVQDKG